MPEYNIGPPSAHQRNNIAGGIAGEPILARDWMLAGYMTNEIVKGRKPTYYNIPK